MLVAPRQLKARKLGSAAGRAALVHAVAHIEFNAINLALDAIYRFRDLPDAYYTELTKVLEQVTGKKIVLVKKQDPSIIAGVVTRVGDKVFDGSVRARLTELKERMLAH